MPCNRPKYRNFWRQVARTDEPADPFRDRIFRCLINLDCQIVWTILQTRSPINIVDKTRAGKRRRPRYSRCMPARRFPPPWSVEDNGACFIVRDHGGQKLAYIYYEEEPVAGTKDTTKKYRFNSRCEAFLARAKHVVAAESSSGWLVEKAINGAIRMKSVPA